MASLLSGIGTILRYASNIQEEGVAKGTLKSLEDKKITLLRADGSMMKLLDKYVVEPMAVVSKDLATVEELENILGLHADMFTGYYMQVFDILRDHYGVGINVAVDTLATDNGGLERVITKGIEGGLTLVTESRHEDIDYLGALIHDAELSTEKEKDNLNYTTAKAMAEKMGSEYGRHKVREEYRKHMKKIDKKERKYFTGKDFVAEATRLSESHKDLLIPNAIQRTIQITAEVVNKEPDADGVYHTRTFIIPVTIKLAVMFVSEDSILNMLEVDGDDATFEERWDAYQSGAISLADFMFASDLIKKYKKHKLKDKDGLIQIIKSREFSANSKMLSNGFAGFEKYYNMYLLSPQVKAAVEKEIRAKLITPKGKEKFLEQAHGLSVTIVDPDYERIQIMLKDIRGKTDLSFKSAIKKEKGGADYSEIVKALIANKPPAF